MKFLEKFMVLLINFYQYFSRWTIPHCRFYPSCSEYTKQALLKYGLAKGLLLGISRISRCHPYHAGGYDPLI